MNAVWQIAGALGSVGVLIALVTAVRVVARRQGWPAELQRKLVHIGTGLYAICLPWMFAEDWPIYLLLALSIGVMLALRLAKSGLGGTLHDVGRTSYGDILLAVSIGLVLLFSERDPLLYVLPLAVLTLSDAAAALAGTSYGRNRFTVEEGQKSWEGSIIFFLVTLVLAQSVLVLTTPLPGPDTLLLALLVALFGTQFEADSWRGFDNLFVPMGVLILVAIHRDSGAWLLAGLCAGFVAGLLIMPRLARALGLSAHVGRVYLVALVLILTVTAPANSLLPALVLVAHLSSRSLAPSDDPYPELDVVAALALVSFGWLAVGEAVGVNALLAYGLTCAGLAVALMACAGGVAGAIAAAGAFALWWLFVVPDASGALIAAGAGALTLVLGVTLAIPRAQLARLRVLKLAPVALLPAVALYLARWGGLL